MNFDPKADVSTQGFWRSEVWARPEFRIEGVRFSCGHRVQWAQEALCVEPHRCGFRKLFYIYDRLIKDSVYRGSFCWHQMTCSLQCFSFLVILGAMMGVLFTFIFSSWSWWVIVVGTQLHVWVVDRLACRAPEQSSVRNGFIGMVLSFLFGVV